MPQGSVENYSRDKDSRCTSKNTTGGKDGKKQWGN